MTELVTVKSTALAMHCLPTAVSSNSACERKTGRETRDVAQKRDRWRDDGGGGGGVMEGDDGGGVMGGDDGGGW